MPKEEKKALKITCDNPACPGTDLKPNKEDGWLNVYAEVYGSPGKQLVYCSTGCVSAHTASDPDAWLPPEPEEPLV